MCLLVFQWRPDTPYPLVFAGNRDEFHERPAEPLHWWDTPAGLLAGRDLTGGGTWLGYTRSGRFAVVTNFREMGDRHPEAPSRGGLITALADPEQSVADYGDELAAAGARYAGYNLLYGEPAAGSLSVYSNRDGPARPLAPGIHGLSNHLLDTPWPKLVLTRDRFRDALVTGDPDIETLFGILGDRKPAPDDQLPDTGIGPEWERLLSSPFIVSPRYGTRCSTVVIVEADGAATVAERSFGIDGDIIAERRERVPPPARQV